jgi:hypothetical protein
MHTQFYLKQNTVSQVSHTDSAQAESPKMKTIMDLDRDAGVRQIVSVFLWANLTTSLTKTLAGGLVSFRRVSIFFRSSNYDSITIPRFLELKIRSGERQVRDADSGSSESC